MTAPRANTPSRRDEVTPAQWDELRRRLIEWTGLDFSPRRAGELQQAMAGASAELGAEGVGQCVRRLLQTRPVPAEISVLAQHLTVGETYFFRDPKAMDALAGEVLPALVEKRRGGRQALSLWSAGCCTGEEPYSLAMMVRRLLPRLDGWDVRITGSDLNPRFLDKARSGIYGDWSFRAGPHPLYRRFFRKADTGRTAVSPEIMAMVSFQQGNLAGDAAWTPAHDGHGFDLILCRNVLMYFSPDTMARVVARLRHALAPDGLLLVSPSETSDALFSGFTARGIGGVRFYEKQAGGALLSQPASQASAGVPLLPEATAAFVAPPRMAAGPAAAAIRARAFADTGKLDEARACCAEWIAADPLDAGARYLHAMVLRELGEGGAAAVELGKAVFLDSGFVMAHVALGRAALDEGNEREARRHFANAKGLLRQAPAGQDVAEADGLNAGQVLEVLAAMSQREETQ